MSGLFRRIRRARAATSEPVSPESPGVSSPNDAPPPGPGSAAAGPWRDQAPPAGHSGAASEAPTDAVLAWDTEAPAGLELDELVGRRPSGQRRGRLRRRARHLTRVREILLRDLGGYLYEIHRSSGAGSVDGEHQRRVLAGKLERLALVDGELREHEEILGSRRGPTVLREPGIGGTCPACGEIHGSEARFCSACGNPVAPGATRLEDAGLAVGRDAAQLSAGDASLSPITAAAADPAPAVPDGPVAPRPDLRKAAAEPPGQAAPAQDTQETPVVPAPGPGAATLSSGWTKRDPEDRS